MDEDQLLLFKTIFEQTPISTQIFTPDGETLFVNKAWEKLWNIKFTQIKSYNILHDKQLIATGTMSYIKKGFKGEIVQHPPIMYSPSKSITIPGTPTYRWLQANMYPIRNNKGQITHIVLQHDDITLRKESEEQIYRLAAIVESSDDAIISKTLQGVITSWNKAATQLFGYDPDEAIGKHISLLIPTELLSEEKVIISKLKKGEHIEHYETTRIDKFGKRLSVSLSISPIKTSQGTVIGASKIARNISDKKKAEQQLKENEERLRIALEAGEIGVWDWDIADNILTWTDKVYSIHGVSKKDFKLSFENFSALVHPQDRAYASNKIKESISQKKPFVAQFRIITPQGQTRWVSTQASLTLNEKGEVVRMLGATTNITHQKQMEQDKSDFLSMASHELKTPLTSMKMFIDLLRKYIDRTELERPKYFAKRIYDQANRLTELTNDLLDVSRIETGKLRLSRESFDFDSFIIDTVEGIQASTEDHVITIKKNPHFSIYADKYRLYQVLVNLLTNAIKYSPKSKGINVTVKKTKKSVVVGVQDFGIGIKEDQQKRIFERLYQVNDPEEKTYPGLGLGLYISKEIISRHEGKIWVESKKDQGSTFYFSIPI